MIEFEIKNPIPLFEKWGINHIDHLSPSIMVKGLKDIHPWPLLSVTLSIYKNKVKFILFPVFVGPNVRRMRVRLIFLTFTFTTKFR